MTTTPHILVTGGAGFIGSALVLHLVQEKGYRVTTVDALTYAAHPHSLDALHHHPKHRLIEADINDVGRMRAILGDAKPDAVMHLAAESHVDRSIQGPGAFIRTNVLGTQVLLEAVRHVYEGYDLDKRTRFRFVHISTDEVFGSLGEEGFFNEQTRYDPRSPYSASKAASDHLVRAWGHTYGLPTLIANCSNNYGPRQFPEKLIPLMILNALESKPLPVYGDGLNIRDWLYVDDHVRALTLILEKGTIGETYLIGGRAERTNKQVVEAICAVFDALKPENAPHARLITRVTDRPGHDRRYAIDPSHIENTLGWRAQVTFEEGLQQTIDWYLNNQNWWQPLRENVYAGERLGLSKQSAQGDNEDGQTTFKPSPFAATGLSLFKR
jgi:dTDP-glucose 4,6-dehydratase